MIPERRGGETTLRPWVARRILACLFAAVLFVAHYTTELIEGRELLGLTFSVWVFVPMGGFLVALLVLPRISQTTVRQCYLATAAVAVLSLWPLFLVVLGPAIHWAVWTVIYGLNPILLYAGALTVLLGSGVLERARIRESDDSATSSLVDSHSQ